MRRVVAIGAAVAVAGVAAAPVADAAKRRRPRAHHVVRKASRPMWLSPRGALRAPVLTVSPGVTVSLPGLPPVTVPSPTALLLPSRTGVLLDEWRVAPARNPVAAGAIELDATNSGEDAHDLTVARDGVVVAQTAVLEPGQATALTATLPAGDYRLYCSLYDGAHDTAGMHATLKVR
jgi:hypothetical protein